MSINCSLDSPGSVLLQPYTLQSVAGGVAAVSQLCRGAGCSPKVSQCKGKQFSTYTPASETESLAAHSH